MGWARSADSRIELGPNFSYQSGGQDSGLALTIPPHTCFISSSVNTDGSCLRGVDSEFDLWSTDCLTGEIA